VALAAGCQVPTQSERTYTATDVRPRCAEDARWWERKANGELVRGNDVAILSMRRQHYDAAIRDLKVARDLYYDELLGLERQATREHPIPLARREALDAQIERLQREIEQVYKDRPIDQE
jgi:hypothetical protein